jgi:membrane protein required for colicin V production
MNVFDALIVVLLLFFTVIGAWRGFVRELASLLTWVLACLIAWVFAPDVAGMFDGLTRDATLQQVFGFALIFVSVFVAGTVASFFLHRFLSKSASFRLPNRLLGGAVGLTRGAAVVVLLFLFAGLTSVPQRAWWRTATLAPVFEHMALYISGYIPRDVARHIRYG